MKNMKVKDLIKVLEGKDPEAMVICQKDGEGNGYSPLSGVWTGVYVPETTWSGEVMMAPEDLDAETRKAGYTEEDVHEVTEETPRCIVLHPTN